MSPQHIVSFLLRYMRLLPTTLLKFDISPTGSIGAFPRKLVTFFFLLFLLSSIYSICVLYMYMHFTCYWVPHNTTKKATSSFFDEYSVPYALIIHRSFPATRCRCMTVGWHVQVQLAARLHVSISQLSKRRMLSVVALTK